MAVDTVINNGAAANRVDIIFLGDGYTAGEVGTTYRQHVKNLTDYLFESTGNAALLTQPFGRYKKFFNVHIIDVVSAQSGADIPPGTFVDTALGSTFFFDGVTERLLSVDQALTDTVMNNALAGTGIPPEMRFVTVNTVNYGGAGGFYATYAGGNADALEVAVHEVAHSFANLADEYGGAAGPYAGQEPAEVNVSKDATGNKWAHWLGHTEEGIGTIGAFEGARYFNTGLWRPSNTSKMNILNNPFDAVSREQFILKFYELVDPIDNFTAKGGPAGTIANSVAVANVFDFMVDTIDEGIIKQGWTIAGFTGDLGTATTLDIRALDLQPGKIELRVRAFDDTPWVRIQKDLLEQTVVWDLTVAPTQTLTGDGGDNMLRGAFTADTLNGGAGFDTLIGYFGNDVLNGGANPAGQGDFLFGGPGDDTYHVDSPLDFVDEGNFPAFAGFGFGGTDTIVSTADFFWDLYSVGETLRVSDDVVDIGGDGVTIVHSVFSGTLVGHSGTDIMFGRGGSDIYRPGGGVDFMSFSTLGVTDAPGYVANGVNTLVMEVGNSYDIVFEFEVGRDKVDVSAFGFASLTDFMSRGVNDGIGNSYFVLGAGFDYLYLVGLELGELQAGDFIV